MSALSSLAVPRLRRRAAPGRPLANMRGVMTMAAMAVVLAMAPRADALEMMFRNECGKDMVMSNGKTFEKIKKDGYLMKTLEVGAVEAFRYGTGNQATLAEFSVKETTTWYDIGIIPTGPSTGPGNCSSLEDCKAVTGGTGFNVPMKIVPGFKGEELFGGSCMTVNCFADGCEDAYQHPNDPGKTRNCPASAHFTVVFCATPSTGSSDGSLGWNGEFESAVITTPAPTPKATPPPSTEQPQIVSTAHAQDSGDGTSVAVIIASIIGGFVAVFAAVVLVRRFRYTQLEKRNAARCSSDAIMYMEARDTNTL